MTSLLGIVIVLHCSFPFFSMLEFAYYFVCVCMTCAMKSIQVSWHVHGGQRVTCGNWFWGIRFRLSGLCSKCSYLRLHLAWCIKELPQSVHPDCSNSTQCLRIPISGVSDLHPSVLTSFSCLFQAWKLSSLFQALLLVSIAAEITHQVSCAVF